MDGFIPQMNNPLKKKRSSRLVSTPPSLSPFHPSHCGFLLLFFLIPRSLIFCFIHVPSSENPVNPTTRLREGRNCHSALSLPSEACCSTGLCFYDLAAALHPLLPFIHQAAVKPFLLLSSCSSFFLPASFILTLFPCALSRHFLLHSPPPCFLF